MSEITDERVKVFKIDKCKTWTGGPRNKGLDEAKGEWVVYLDIDDILGDNHLQNISNGLNGFDWVWFDDVRYAPRTGEWYENRCNINQIGFHGTSNIAHKSSLEYRWDHKGYAHDYYFIRNLKQNKNFEKIEGGEYYVCHLPPSTLGKGYDL